MGTHFEVVLPVKSTPLIDDRHDASVLEAKKPGMSSVVQPDMEEAASDETARSRTKARPQEKQGLDQMRTPGRVIIAEDEAINRIYLKRVLENAGYEVTQAADGEAALAAATMGDWNFILMDVSMPRMDGLEATRRIRAFQNDHSMRRVPIIALTAHAYAEDRAACTDAGMDGFLSKPFTEAALWVEVKRAVAIVEASGAKGNESEHDVGQ